MIIDMATELREFPYLTSLFKYIESYNIMGHQIGRKIGDMLEILTMGMIYRNPQLLRHLDTEGKLEGYTTAGHKVEFGFFDNPLTKDRLFGSIECKCVGVEVTKSGSNGRHLRRIGIGDAFSVSLSASRGQTTHNIGISLREVNNNQASIECGTEVIAMQTGDSIRIAIDEHNNLTIVSPRATLYNTVPGIIRKCKIVTLDRIENNHAVISLWDCLTGPQTIEKAKQASLVAMDIRRKIDGHWGKEDIAEEQKTVISILVLCEFSHWESKSRNVIRTCIDHNLIVPDAIMINAFQEFEQTFGFENMQPKITKNEFSRSADVRDAVFRVIERYENRILFDIESNAYVDFSYDAGKLRLTAL